jgi:aspartyl-tRNA(Asn)/glutamyl-tRNA(Gln) amidotransferase subunit A
MPTKPSASTRRRFLASGGAAVASLAANPASGRLQELADVTLKKASEMLRSKATSPVELTQACLKRIANYNSLLNAFVTVTEELALVAAREAEAEQRRGRWRGPLHGIPIALKDNIDTAAIRTTAASELFRDRIPSEDAEVVRRLKNAGAILLGKTNLHEFAYGGSSSITYFGPVHNPWALDRIPGGSSGGSAAATATGLCFGSLGTDTAGSIRIPACYCGIVGFKPTYGRVSNRGVIPLSWTLDHVGPICRTVEDAALMLGVIAGYDEQDTTTMNVPVPDYSRDLRTHPSKLRLAIARTPYFDDLDPEIAKAVETAIGVLSRLTAGVSEVTLPLAGFLPGDLFSNLRAIEAYAYHAEWITKSPEKYQRVTRDRIIQLSAGVQAADYVQARRQLDRLRREIKNTFSNVDLLITPTMPRPPVPIEEGGTFEAVPTRNTAPFDVFGLPTISVPCGFMSAGLPIGLQIIGAPFAESRVLALAHAYEQVTEWHNRHPKLNTV